MATNSAGADAALYVAGCATGVQLPAQSHMQTDRRSAGNIRLHPTGRARAVVLDTADAIGVPTYVQRSGMRTMSQGFQGEHALRFVVCAAWQRQHPSGEDGCAERRLRGHVDTRTPRPQVEHARFEEEEFTSR